MAAHHRNRTLFDLWVTDEIISAFRRDLEGRTRSAGTFSSQGAADRAGNRDGQKVLAESWRDASLGAITFTDYVANDWLPSKHIEPTTKAAYVSNLNKHFYP